MGLYKYAYMVTNCPALGEVSSTTSSFLVHRPSEGSWVDPKSPAYPQTTCLRGAPSIQGIRSLAPARNSLALLAAADVLGIEVLLLARHLVSQGLQPHLEPKAALLSAAVFVGPGASSPSSPSHPNAPVPSSPPPHPPVHPADLGSAASGSALHASSAP